MEHPIQQINFVNTNAAWLIEASAGTGKTWTIERLYIKALLESNQVNSSDNSVNSGYDSLITVDNILVVTFTNDATDELKSRIYEQLQVTIDTIIYLNNHNNLKNDSDLFVEYLAKRYVSQDHTRDLTILNRALQSFDMASIHTIHGLCHRLLQDYPLECLVNNLFEITSDNLELYTRYTTEFIHTQIMTNPKYSNDIAIMLENLNNDKLFGRRGDYTISLAKQISKALPADLFIRNDNSYTFNYQIDYTPSLELLTTKLHTDEDKRQAKGAFIACLVEYLQAKYAQVMLERNILSFNEIIQNVIDAMKNNPALADKVFKRYPIAFIDEFQDTDKQQLELFDLIYHLDQNQRGHIIIVGDPKQAIYRFRGANVDSYIKARSKITNHISLQKNYRTSTNIMQFINQLFNLNNQNATVKNSFLGNDINYEEGIAAAKQENSILIPDKQSIQGITKSVGVEAEFYDEDVQLVVINGNTRDQRDKQLLNCIAFEILALLRSQANLQSKIAILVTRNAQATEIVTHLKRYGIRATQVKLGSIFAEQSALDLYMILQGIFDLTNLDYFTLAITSRLFNISLTNLHDKLQNEIIIKLRRDFFNYKYIWNSQGLLALIYNLFQDIIQSNTKLDKREVANIWQLAELLNKHNNKINNQMELLYWFKDKIDNAQNNLKDELDGDNEELIRLDNDDEQIIVTTQHKAKGLEYDILFCPYFKANIELDMGSYSRPFFSNYTYNGKEFSSLVSDPIIAKHILEDDNKEAHRLNYVSLTRAKIRLYIYLKQNTYTTKGQYNKNQKPDKIAELFGYCASSINDSSHTLFDYPKFFSTNPSLAIKQPSLLPGVIAYNRDNLLSQDLDKLSLKYQQNSEHNFNELSTIDSKYLSQKSWARQSYSGIVKSSNLDDIHDYYEEDTLVKEVKLDYIYNILTDGLITGAIFGTLFHELCENYPLDQKYLITKLGSYSLSSDKINEYTTELLVMLDKAFNYPLIHGMCLNQLGNLCHELEFNLNIKQNVSVAYEIGKLITEHFGQSHPFSLTIKDLGSVLPGFLVGFIDLVVCIDGKYWVIDYKTNTLDDYTTNINNSIQDNVLVESMANHHYYLQYLIYMVALKRYLELHLHLEDASDLLGGSVYYYVRGIYTSDIKPNDGIYLDDTAQELVGLIDNLFKGT